MKNKPIEDFKVEPPKYSFYSPEYSEWTCYLFGGSTSYIPLKGQVPNRFVRFMMRICFNCKWVKKEKWNGKDCSKNTKKWWRIKTIWNWRMNIKFYLTVLFKTIFWTLLILLTIVGAASSPAIFLMIFIMSIVFISVYSIEVHKWVLY